MDGKRMATEELNRDLVCAVDLGGTYLRTAIIDANGEIRFRLKQRTPATDDPQEVLAAIIAAARKCDEHSQAEGQSVGTISVVVPGTVNIVAGTVTRIPNVPSLDSFELATVLSDALKRPVMLENDANAAAVGEMWLGAARGHRTVVCVTLGTGVGSGIILDGELWHGANDSAGEIGHTSIEPFNGPPCSCGSRGCLEVYASATAIVRMASEALTDHPSSVLNATDNLTAEKIFAAGKDGDALALEVFQRVGDYLGVGLANVINILNPEMIVIGGGVANGWELFEDHMHQRILEYAFRLPAAEAKIVPAECGDDAGLLGAARLSFSTPDSL
jgi:glucokinase